MEQLIGTIMNDGRFVELEDGRKFELPVHGTTYDGCIEVLIDAKSVGGDGWMYRQSSKPYIGMKVEFYTNNGKNGFDFKIINSDIANSNIENNKNSYLGRTWFIDADGYITSKERDVEVIHLYNYDMECGNALPNDIQKKIVDILNGN